MTEKKVAPYGSWKSPITSDLIVAGAVGLGQLMLDGEDIYWIESRPSEKGRNVIVRRTPDGQTSDVTPPSFSARTRVHEYGGGSFVVNDSTVYFSNFVDQQLYRQHSGEQPIPISPIELVLGRYADAVIDSERQRLFCVCENHHLLESDAEHQVVSTDAILGQRTETVHIQKTTEPSNYLINIKLDDSGYFEIIASGYDFYASPRLSPDRKQLAWICWNHPNMPWDGTELWLADVNDNGTLSNEVMIAGSESESIFQPEWSPDGVLHFVSDRTNWWNLYRWHNGQIEALCPMNAEFGLPQWVFRMSTYAFISSHEILCSYIVNGISYLGILNTETKNLEPINLPYTRISDVCANNLHAVFTAASPTEPNSVIEFDLTSRQYQVLRRSTDLQIEEGYISVPEAIEYPTENGLTAHAFYYPPTNKDFVAPEGERPPLLVEIHGGPTAATAPTFKLGILYWTSRGIGVLDVNYGGSTGYGREYRDRLKGTWGVVDVDDCVNGAKFLAERGDADINRLCITGGSAGGYTTLCALTFRDVFKAGASHYGVSDLIALDEDTHKFEARYTASLVGPWPAARDLYIARSPIHHVDELNAPVIFFQGLEDKIVPPNQAEMMVEALRKKGLPVAYVAFEGEQHGFRQAANIKRALDGELYFYSRIFGFELADKVEPVQIENLK